MDRNCKKLIMCLFVSAIILFIVSLILMNDISFLLSGIAMILVGIALLILIYKFSNKSIMFTETK